MMVIWHLQFEIEHFVFRSERASPYCVVVCQISSVFHKRWPARLRTLLRRTPSTYVHQRHTQPATQLARTPGLTCDFQISKHLRLWNWIQFSLIWIVYVFFCPKTGPWHPNSSLFVWPYELGNFTYEVVSRCLPQFWSCVCECLLFIG